MVTHEEHIHRRYKAGYVVWNQLVSHDGNLEEAIWIKWAFTPDGNYIGDSRWAYRLCKLRGIVPELRLGTSNVCSVGFCEKEQKWYGWSHRAMFGFGIGSVCKPGDVGYAAKNRKAFKERLLADWKSKGSEVASAEEDTGPGGDELGIRIEWVPDKSGDVMGIFQAYPEEFGRGTWVAESIADAREMACDFAQGVS